MTTNDTLQSKRKEAIKIVSQIKDQSKLLEDNVQKSKSMLSEIAVDSDDAKKLNSSLSRIINSTDDAIKKFRNERDKISQLLTQVNNFYNNKYLPLLSKIEDDKTGFKERLKLGTEFNNEVIKLRESSRNQYDEVKKYATEIRKSNKELSIIDSSIRKLLQNSTSKNTKINEINSHVNALDIQITKTHKNLNELFLTSQKNEKSISDLLKNAEVKINSIENVKIESEKILEKIQDIYEIAAETGLSGEFDKRRAHLKDLLKKWELRILVTTIILLLVIILMFILQLILYNWDLTNHTFDINFYVRFLIASPIVYYLYFCSGEYNKTKRLHDKYSFKTTLAMSIQHHMELLTSHEKFDNPDRINKILDFILDGFRNIYSEPYSADDYKLKLKLANMEVDIEKKIIETISKTLNIDKENK